MLIVHWRFIVSLLSYFLLWPCFPEVLPLIQHWICRAALFSWVNIINQHSWQDKMIAVYICSANHTYIVDICTKHVHMNWFSHWVAGGRDSGGVPGHKANDSGLKPAFKHFQVWNHWLFLRRPRDSFQLYLWATKDRGRYFWWEAGASLAAFVANRAWCVF